MYDRPNARKGMYLKIRNILISVAAPVNHKVLYPWISFNIIYIMRTKIRIRGIWGFGAVIVLLADLPFCDIIVIAVCK